MPKLIQGVLKALPSTPLVAPMKLLPAMFFDTLKIRKGRYTCDRHFLKLKQCIYSKPGYVVKVPK